MTDAVLEMVRREAERVIARVYITPAVPVYTITIERLTATSSLNNAMEQAGWASLIIVAETAVAVVEVAETDVTLEVSTALGDIPQAVADALELLEEELADRPSIDEVSVVKIGQLGILAIWLHPRQLVVPMALRSPLRGLEPRRIYHEEAFISAVTSIGARLVELQK